MSSYDSSQKIFSSLKSTVRERFFSIPSENHQLENQEKQTKNTHAVEKEQEAQMIAKDKILARYRTHPVLFLLNWGFAFVILIPLFVGFYALYRFVLPEQTEIFILFILTSLLLVTFSFIRTVIHWSLNATVVTDERLIFFKYHGVFKQSTESRSLAQIKSFDLKQEGILQHILNYGNIEVASIISGASTSLVLRNVWPVKEAYQLLSKQTSEAESKPDNSSDISSESE